MRSANTTGPIVAPTDRSSKRAHTLPVIDASEFFHARKFGRESLPHASRLAAEVVEACRTHGMFYLMGHGIDPALMRRVFQESAKFFALPEREKLEISAKKSPHHRGYGLLKNYRDWREQIHFGVEAESIQEANRGTLEPEFFRLWGPNLWPASYQCELKEVTLEYMDVIESLSRTILTLIAEQLGNRPDFFTARMKDRPYLLMKTMSYLPQEVKVEEPESARTYKPKVCNSRDACERDTQMGVTAHCDWSWLTFLLQDDVGGLEAQDKSGNWHKVHPLEGSLVVNTGELLEIETGGRLRSCPHRVINSRIDRQRYSVPVFINPALDAQILPLGLFSGSDASSSFREIPFASEDQRHVHKVVKPGTKLSPFLFGKSEWDRKAEGIWCYDQACVHGL